MLITRVITAQSIITNVKSSPYVTIGISPFHKTRRLAYRPFGSLGKRIMFSLCIFVLQKLFMWFIIYLTGQPEGECESPDPANKF